MGILMWVEEMVKIIFGIKLLDAKKIHQQSFIVSYRSSVLIKAVKYTAGK